MKKVFLKFERSKKEKKLRLLVFSVIFFLLIFIIVPLIFLMIQPKKILEEKIISNQIITSFTPTPEPTKIQPKQIKLLFVGDTMLANTIGLGIKNKKEDPFMYVKDIFKQYDYVYANLETNLSEASIGSPAPGKSWTFKAPVEALPVIKDSGIDIVSLANNHTMDYGKDALINQLDNLDKFGIKYFGAGKNSKQAFAPLFVEVAGLKLAFLGMNEIETLYSAVKVDSPGSAYFNKILIKEALDEARKNADIVIVAPHWGTEGSPYTNSIQEEYSKFFIDNGADLIVGNHPHIIQKESEYKGKKIYYSLGNFVMETAMTGPSTQGNMLEVIIENKKFVSTKLIPIKLVYSFPRLVKTQE